MTQQPIKLDQLMQELLEHLEETHEAVADAAAFVLPDEGAL